MEQAAALAARQAQEDDESILPKVTLDDVPRDIPRLEHGESRSAGFNSTQYAQGTNGLVYQQALCQLPALSADALALLPTYTNVLTEVGLGETSYLEVQDRQAAVCGSINAFTSMRGGVNDVQEASGYVVLSSKALLRNHEEQARLMRETLSDVRFDETARLRELVAQQRARREQAVTGNGHGLGGYSLGRLAPPHSTRRDRLRVHRRSDRQHEGHALRPRLTRRLGRLRRRLQCQLHAQ